MSLKFVSHELNMCSNIMLNVKNVKLQPNIKRRHNVSICRIGLDICSLKNSKRKLDPIRYLITPLSLSILVHKIINLQHKNLLIFAHGIERWNE